MLNRSALQTMVDNATQHEEEDIVRMVVMNVSPRSLLNALRYSLPDDVIEDLVDQWDKDGHDVTVPE